MFNHAREHGDDFQRILTRYAIERLLYRLAQTEAAESYVLKGAMLFVTWPEYVSRPTGDFDLLGHGDPDSARITELFARICRIDAPNDGIIFDPTSLAVETMREADEYQGIRLRLIGNLSKAIIRVQVDIGFGDHVHPAPTRRIFPSLLSGLATPNILMYPPETVVAGKFEAMIRFGEVNGRIKDFYDLWVASRTFGFKLAELLEAIAGTLRRRKTAIPAGMPVGLTEKFAAVVDEKGLWTGFLRRSPPSIKPPTFRAMQEELRRYFGPVIEALTAPVGARSLWDRDGGAWR